MEMYITLDYQDEKLDFSLKDKIKRFKEITSGSSDLMINEVEICGVKTALLSCEGMMSTQVVTRLVLVPLTELNLNTDQKIDATGLFNHIDDHMLLSVDRPKADNYGDAMRLINSGFAVLIADGNTQALGFGVQGYGIRGISEPTSEQNIMGSHDAFTETIRINMSLIRRRLKTPFLKQELMVMGSKSHTDICLVYMTDRVSKNLINRMCFRADI